MSATGKYEKQDLDRCVQRLRAACDHAASSLERELDDGCDDGTLECIEALDGFHGRLLFIIRELSIRVLKLEAAIKAPETPARPESSATEGDGCSDLRNTRELVFAQAVCTFRPSECGRPFFIMRRTDGKHLQLSLKEAQVLRDWILGFLDAASTAGGGA